MDLTTLIGLIIGIGGLVGGFLLEGGELGSLFIETAGIIVLGGTIGAVTISFSLEEIRLCRFSKGDFHRDPGRFCRISGTFGGDGGPGARERVAQLGKPSREIDSEFMRRRLQLVIDGTDPELTRNMLEMEISAFEQNNYLGAEIFNSAGGFAPTMGIIGTVMGLVHVLGNLSDPDKLGPAIAMAFIATLYGVATANLLWIPFGTKLKSKLRDRYI